MRHALHCFFLVVPLLASAAVEPLLAQPSAASLPPTQAVLLGMEGGITYARLSGGQNFGFRYVYPLGNMVELLKFNSLGSGMSGMGGLRIQLPLSERFGLIVGLQDVGLATGATQTIVRNPAPEISGTQPATVWQQYEDDWRFTNAELLLRYRLVPSWLYGFAGGSLAVLTSDGFNATQQILSGGSFEQFPSGTPTGSTFIQLKNYFSVQYYELLRGAFTAGLGSMFEWEAPIFGPVVIAPEVALNVPLTRLFNAQSRAIYASDGITAPNLWYGTFSITFSTPLSSAEPQRARPGVPTVSYIVTDDRERGPQQPPSERAIAVQGVVRDENTGTPLRATLTAIDLTHGARVATSTADSSGHYVLRLPAAGHYSITAEAPAYLFHSLEIAPAQDTGRIDLAPLTLAASSSGRTELLIFFGYNNATLIPESYPELFRVVDLLANAPEMKIEIAGHTSSEGSDDYNQRLSEERAGAVRNFLVLHGIAGARITAVGFGKSQPVASNESEEGRAKNRRVELRVLPAP